ncbi:MAG: diguanylate cyclase [Gallionella sp.]|nr:MAG: diguanylate cyclase [Gallionella sp.]
MIIENLKRGVAGAYVKLNDAELHAEFERVVVKSEAPDATVFSRMLRELHAHQIELEIQNRELLKARRQLEESRDRYVSLYDSAALGYFSFDPHGLVMEANLAGASLVRADRSSLIGMPFINFVARRDRNKFLHHIHKYLSGDTRASAEFTLELLDGKSIAVQMTGAVPRLAGDKTKYCRAVLTDITERKLAERKLHLSAKALENIQEGVMLTDAQTRIIAVNSAFSWVTGYSADEAVGNTPTILKSGLNDDEFYRRMYASLKKNDGWQGEIRNRRKNGEIYLEWLNINVIRNDGGEIDYYIGVFSDISNQEEMKKRLHKLAYYDELTGLPNRTLLYDRLSLDLVHSRRNGSMMAILFVDLDGFKAINDLYGHGAGDQFLREVAERLVSCIREGDTLSRMGGDEFVALLGNIADEQVAAQVAERMLETCAEPFVIEGHELFVTVSVGISIHPRDGDNGNSLLRNADTAMYRAKTCGKNNYQFFSEPAAIG